MIVRLDLYLFWNHDRKKKKLYFNLPQCVSRSDLWATVQKDFKDLVRDLDLTKPLDTQLI